MSEKLTNAVTTKHQEAEGMRNSKHWRPSSEATVRSACLGKGKHKYNEQKEKAKSNKNREKRNTTQ
jgi:hypothetical protein